MIAERTFTGWMVEIDALTDPERWSEWMDLIGNDQEARQEQQQKIGIILQALQAIYGKAMRHCTEPEQLGCELARQSQADAQRMISRLIYRYCCHRYPEKRELFEQELEAYMPVLQRINFDHMTSQDQREPGRYMGRIGEILQGTQRYTRDFRDMVHACNARLQIKTYKNIMIDRDLAQSENIQRLLNARIRIEFVDPVE